MDLNQFNEKLDPRMQLQGSGSKALHEAYDLMRPSGQTSDFGEQ